MSNYKVLSILRLLKSTIGLFVDSFFVMYFLKVSNNNVAKLGLYYIIIYSLVFITIYMCKNMCKNKGRMNLLRIGIVLNFIYFLLILILKQNIVDYMYLMAVIYGLEEGFYYSMYNNIESTGVSNEQRAKFAGIYTFLKSIISIIFPLIFGSIINETGFQNCTLIIIILVILQIIFSMLYKDISIKNNNKSNLKEFLGIIKKNTLIKRMYKVCFFNGFIFSGAFSSIVVIYIIKVLNSSLDLGIFTSVFAIITSIIGLLFAKVIPKNKYKSILKLTLSMTVLGIIISLFKVNFVTVLIFNLFQTISLNLFNLIIQNAQLDLSNDEEVKKVYKVEYFVCMEFVLFIGRVLGYILYIFLGLSTIMFLTNFILIVFIILIILLGYSAISLLKEVDLKKVKK